MNLRFSELDIDKLEEASALMQRVFCEYNAAGFYKKLGFIGDEEQIINKGMKVIMMTYHHDGGEQSIFSELFDLLDEAREKYGEEKLQQILAESAKAVNETEVS